MEKASVETSVESGGESGMKAGMETGMKSGAKTGAKTSAKKSARTSARTSAKRGARTSTKTGTKTGAEDRNNGSRQIRKIPARLLRRSPSNARTMSGDTQAFRELKASIGAHDVLQSLLVREQDGEGFEVIAGGRRLEAVNELISEGRFDAGHEVPCVVEQSPGNDIESSLNENAMREPMHPADEYAAFRALADAGETAEGIAERTGYSVRTVRRRMRLGDVAPELVKLYRDGKIIQETLMAFAITSDHARQMEVYRELEAGMSYWHSHDVRAALTKEGVHSSSAQGTFVSRKAYTDAGGRIENDLFGEKEAEWLLDGDLVRRLCLEKLEEQAETLRKEWKWAEAVLDLSWSTLEHHGRVDGCMGTATNAEAERIAALEAQLEQVCKRRDKQSDISDEQLDKADKIEGQLRELKMEIAERRVFSTNERAISGCIVTIGPDGDCRVEKGLVRREDMPKGKSKRNGAERSNSNGNAELLITDDESDGDTSEMPVDVRPPLMSGGRMGPSAEAAQANEIGIPMAVSEELQCIRTEIVRAALAQNPEAAINLLTFSLAGQVLGDPLAAYTARSEALDVTAVIGQRRPQKEHNNDAWLERSPGERLTDMVEVPLGWLKKKSEKERWEAFTALHRIERAAVLAKAVAMAMTPRLAYASRKCHVFEATVARLAPDFAALVRPRGEQFWKRVAKERTLKVADAVFGPEWTARHSKLKRAELATAMEAAFAGKDDSLDPAARQRAAEWTLPGFTAFDNRALGDEPPHGQEGTGAVKSPDEPERTGTTKAMNQEDTSGKSKGTRA